MFKFLIAILLFSGLILLLAGSFGLRLLRSFLGFDKKPRENANGGHPDSEKDYSQSHEKIISKSEGEYVDFEEVRDEPEE
ncbi:MAG: DUF4834 family protein [Paludibacteraceae bacterium]